MDNRPIGIFDSGVGGLTVASQVMKQLTNEEVVYFGDTARLPYGSKTKETVTKFSKQDVRFLLKEDVKAVIIACNTASANSLLELRASFDVPIFGVVTPGAKEALEATRNKRIGVIATSSTIKSGAYQQAILKGDREVSVYAKACPLFVPLAEEGWGREEITKLTAQKYLKDLIREKVDTIVMGCTHYPLLQDCIKEVAGEGVVLVDPAYETARMVKDYLRDTGMLREDGARPVHRFFVSDKTDMFERICGEALEQNYYASEIDIEKF